MNSIELNSTDPYSLLRIGEAWRNRPGLTTLLLTFVVIVLLLVLGASAGTGPFALTALLAVLFSFAGFSAAGIQFMDQAAGRPVTPVLAAFLGSPMVLLRSLGLTLVFILAFVGYVAVALVILVLCKIPALGPLLYVVALPVLTFLGSLVFLGLTVAGLISGAALWEGHSLAAALAQGWAAATQRPMHVFLSLVMLFIVTVMVSLVVTGFVYSGFGIAGMLSAKVLGNESSGGLSTIMGSLMGGGLGGNSSGGGLVFAGLLGSAIVFAVMQALYTAIFTLGLTLTYLKLTAGLDVSAARSAMDSAIAKTKEKAQQAAVEAKRRAGEAQAAAQQRLELARTAQASRAAAAASPALACPACHSTTTAEDEFCGGCGHKLR